MSVERECEQTIAGSRENVLMSIQHIGLWSIRDLTDAAVPEDRPIRGIKRDQIAGVVSGEEKPACSGKDAAHCPAGTRRILMTPRGLTGFVVNGNKVAPQIRDRYLFFTSQAHRTVRIGFSEVIHCIRVISIHVKQSCVGRKTGPRPIRASGG